MSAVTDTDLKRLEDLIIGIANGQKAIETRLTGVETRLTAIEVGQTEIKGEIKTLQEGQRTLELGQSDIRGDIKVVNARLDGIGDRIKPIDKIPDLAERVGEFKIWRQVVIIAFTALLTGVVTWIVRSANLSL
jgi:hypothetical protein